MFTTTLVAIAKAALEHHARGELGYQNVRNHSFGCRYRYDDGRACAIGAGLPDVVAVKFDGNGSDNSTVQYLIEHHALSITDDFEVHVGDGDLRWEITFGEFETPGPVAASTLLQYLHDNLTFTPRHSPSLNEEHLLNFLHLLVNGERPVEFRP